MGQKLSVAYMLKNLKRVVLDDRSFEYKMYEEKSDIDMYRTQLTELCSDFDAKIEFVASFVIKRSHYVITLLCGPSHKNVNAIIIENKSNSECIGKVLNGKYDKDEYDLLISIIDVLVMKGNESESSETKSGYEIAIKRGFKGSKNEWLKSILSESNPTLLYENNVQSISSEYKDLFTQISEYDNYIRRHSDEECRTVDEDINNEMYDEITVDIGDMLDSTSTALYVLEEAGILDSISSTDELANITRALYFEHLYNKCNLQSYDEDDMLSEYVDRLPILDFILYMDDSLNSLLSYGIEYTPSSFIELVNDMIYNKIGSIENIKITPYITIDRKLQIFDETEGHEKLLLFISDIHDIVDYNKFEVRDYLPHDVTSDKLEASLSLFTISLSQNQMFLSKLVELSIGVDCFFDIDDIFKNDDIDN